MKKGNKPISIRITAFIICLLLSRQLLAQFSLSPEVFYGRSKITDSRKSETEQKFSTKYRNSFVAGASSRYIFRKWFAIRLGVFYDQLNTESLYERTAFDYKSTTYYKKEYLSVPLTMQFKIKKLSLNIGYQSSFILSDQVVTNIDAPNFYPPYNHQSYSSKDSLMFTNLSLVAGISYKIVKNIHIEARFTRGLNDFEIYSPYKRKTIQFLLGISYDFQFKQRDKKEKQEKPTTKTAPEIEKR